MSYYQQALQRKFNIELTRKCSDCKETKSLESFYRAKNMPLGHGYICIPCSKSRKQAYKGRELGVKS